MTRAELRTLLGQLLATDNDNYADGDTATINGQINRALRYASRHIRPRFGKVTLTVSTNDQDIPLLNTSKFARRMLSVDRIFKSDGTPIELWPMQRFEDGTNWRFATAGTPQMATITEGLVRFDRPWSGNATLYVAGHGYYADLTDDAHIPELPDTCHEAIAYLAALLAAEPSVTEATAMNRLQMYNARSYFELDEERQRLAHQDLDLTNYGPRQRF